MDYSRNLLFGILAVQLRKISPGKMAEVAAAAAAEPEKDLPARLLDDKLISPDDHNLLVSLVDEAIKEQGGDVDAAIRWIRGTEIVYSSLSEAFSRPTEKYSKPETDLATDEDYIRSLGDMREKPGRYWLKSEHARGGQGRLLLVHDETLGRDIILKELLPVPDPNQEQPTPVRRTASLVARFLQEAKVTSQLEHPSIVPVYEVGLRPDRTPYYTMKLLKGKTLSAALRECKGLPDRLALVRHFADICHGVAYAHSRNVIHRDLKPSNIMIGEFGETVILDWGLAKVLDKPDVQFDAFEKTITAIKVGFDSEHGKTVPGAVLGTPAYMSPEQARGELQKVDKRSDVYGLGMILYELIAGRLPYEQGPVSSILYQVANDKPRSCVDFQHDAPPELVAICNRCLEQQPDKRYQDAAELAEDIDRFLSGALVAAYTYKTRDVLVRYYRRHRAVVNTVAAFVLVLLCLGVYSYINISIARDREAAAHAVAEDEKYVTQMHLTQSYMRQNNYKLARETLWATNSALRNWEWGFLLNRCYLELYTLDDCVTAAYSPDGTRLATTSQHKPIEIRNAEDGSKIGELGEESKTSLYHEYSPDGARIVSARLDGTIHVWNAQTGKLLARMAGHKGQVDFARFDSAGKRIVSCGEDHTVRIWDANSGALLHTIEDPKLGFGSASFSADGQFVVFVTRDLQYGPEQPPQAYTVNIWEPGSDRRVFSIQGSRFALSPDGAQLAVADGTDVVLVAMPNGEVRARLTGHTAFVSDLAISQDGATLVSGSLDGTARAHDISTGSLNYTVDHGDPIRFVRISRDGKRIFTASGDCTIKVWNGVTGSPINTLRGHNIPVLFSAEFSPDGRRIASGSIDQTVKVWEADSSPGQRVVAALDSPVKSASLSPDGKLAAVVLSNQTLEIRRLADGAVIAAMASYAYSSGTDVAFSPDSKRIVAALDEFTPMVWDIETQQVVSKFTGHQGPVHCVAFSPDGKHVVSGSWDNTARIWNAETGTEVRALAAHTDTVRDVAYSPDGRLVATISEDGTAALWDASSGSQNRRFDLHGSGQCLAFSHDGRLLATLGGDQAMRIWNTVSGGEVRSIRVPQSQVGEIAFSPDDTRLATTAGGSVRIWSVRTGDELISPIDSARPSTVSFNGSSNSLFVALDGARTLVEMAPASWDSEKLARAASLPEGERMAVLRGDHAATPQTPQASMIVSVATTPEHAANSLSKLADAMTAASVGASAIPVDGDVYNALARLCVQRGDEILAVNNTPVDSGRIADVARELAKAATGTPPPDIAVSLNRKGLPVTLKCQLVEPVVQEISREVDLKTMRDYFTILRRNETVWRSVMLTNAQNRAAEIGEPAPGGDSINGLWLGEMRDGDVKPHLRTFGLAFDDRIISRDGQRITNYANIRELGDAVVASQGKENAKINTLFEIERGQFQNLLLGIVLN